jgi:hypothetical protein
LEFVLSLDDILAAVDTNLSFDANQGVENEVVIQTLCQLYFDDTCSWSSGIQEDEAAALCETMSIQIDDLDVILTVNKKPPLCLLYPLFRM